MIIIFIFNILFIWGLNFAAYGIFWKYSGRFSLYLESNGIGWLEKPLYACKPCMSSIWGLGFWLIEFDWYLYPIYVICLAGASAILKR